MSKLRLPFPGFLQSATEFVRRCAANQAAPRPLRVTRLRRDVSTSARYRLAERRAYWVIYIVRAAKLSYECNRRYILFVFPLSVNIKIKAGIARFDDGISLIKFRAMIPGRRRPEDRARLGWFLLGANS